MGSANLDDEIPGTPSDGWEPPIRSLPEHRIHRRSWEVVVVGRNSSSFEDDLSIFPPSEHEDLLLDYTLTTSSSSSSSSSSPSSSSSNSSDYHTEYLSVERPQSPFSIPSVYGHLRRLRGAKEWRRMWSFGWWMLTSGFEVVHSKIFSWGRRDGVVGCLAVDERRGVLWAVSMAAVAVLMAFLRRWHRQEKLRLLLLIHEKDQMIGRLLQVLAQRN